MKKTVIITGAGGNLGQATVKKFLDKNYNVIATIHSDAKLPAQNESLTIVKLDLSELNACKQFVDFISNKFNQIDGVLLLAGGFAGGNFISTTMTDVEKQIHLNFTTAFYMTQLVFEKMLSQPSGGRIIFVGAKPGLNGKDAKGSMAYGLAKSLLFRLAEAINAEGSKKNITASIIVPSTIDTPSNRESMPDADFNSWVKPDNIATAMEYICSEEGKPLRETVLKIYGNA